ncbi:MAG: hypothetical protein KatS3mg015_3170 [Fimbriimonadales bacterium]|nr:MAG: hypothetical protein KatS3mg015_3170 [Fimbriimonadales bacterium]
MAPKVYTLRALTDIWTGDAQGKPDRMITTGLLGSIRWWFEIVVRGLGGSACDPTKKGNRCPVSDKKPTEPGHHCVVCEFFGCTGWARKFRFEVLDQSGKTKAAQIKKDDVLQFRFTALRRVCKQEWALLHLTLRLIAEYGAIGGKTVYKPSDEASRQDAPHHRDYGLVVIQQHPEDTPSFSREELEAYVARPRWHRPGHDDFAWASLANFWCVKGRYLARQDSNTSTFNRVIGRPEPKSQAAQGDSWVAGRRARGQPNPQQPESKKVFSFKEPARTFGFVERKTEIDSLFGTLDQLLSNEWDNFSDSEIMTPERILNELFKRSNS